MDIVTLGAALNGSAEYVNSHFVGGTNIQIVDNPDGTQTINASGEVSSEDTVARADIAAIKDGETLDSFGDVETALATKANTSTTYTKTEVDTALDDKVDKEIGKGLSTNDYTTAEKTKLESVAEGAEVNEIEGIKVNNSTVNPDSNKVVSITVPTSAADVSALPNTTKYAAALSLTINSSTYVMTGQLKDQNGDNLGTAQTIDLPLESVVVGGSYNSQTKKVVLTLQNGNTIEFSVADLVSGLQTELSASNKLNPAYIDYDSAHAAVSDTEKAAWNSKQSALTAEQLAAVNSGVTEDNVEQIETNENNISWLVDTGVKNLLDYGKIKTFNTLFTWSGNTGTYSGVTIKIESNAVKISASNASSTVHIYVSAETDTWKNGNTYRLMGVPQASVENVNLNIQSGSPDYYTYYSKISNQEVTFPNVDTRIRFSIESGATFSEVTIPLMMCSVAAYSASSAYQPYALSNAELTAKEQTNENNILFNARNGVTNMTNISDITLSSDGYLANKVDFNASAGTYRLKSIISGGTAKYTVVARTGNTEVYRDDTTISAPNIDHIFTLSTAADSISIWVQLQSENPVAISDTMVYPAALGDISYQPYAMSNAELTAAIQALQAQLVNQ